MRVSRQRPLRAVRRINRRAALPIRRRVIAGSAGSGSGSVGGILLLSILTIVTIIMKAAPIHSCISYQHTSCYRFTASLLLHGSPPRRRSCLPAFLLAAAKTTSSGGGGGGDAAANLHHHHRHGSITTTTTTTKRPRPQPQQPRFHHHHHHHRIMALFYHPRATTVLSLSTTTTIASFAATIATNNCSATSNAACAFKEGRRTQQRIMSTTAAQQQQQETSSSSSSSSMVGIPPVDDHNDADADANAADANANANHLLLLTRTMVYRMRVKELRQELERRGRYPPPEVLRFEQQQLRTTTSTKKLNRTDLVSMLLDDMDNNSNRNSSTSSTSSIHTNKNHNDNDDQSRHDNNNNNNVTTATTTRTVVADDDHNDHAGDGDAADAAVVLAPPAMSNTALWPDPAAAQLLQQNQQEPPPPTPSTTDDAPASATITTIHANKHDQYYDPARTVSIQQLLDPAKTYVLSIKGLSSSDAKHGTGIGIVMRRMEDKGADNNSAAVGGGDKQNGIVWAARQHYPASRSLYEAEYSALVLALRCAVRRFGLRNLVVQLDQPVVMNHLDGIYPVEKDSLKRLYRQVTQLKRDMLSGASSSSADNINGNLSFELISKLRNAETLELATMALTTGVSLNMSEHDSDDDDAGAHGGDGADKRGNDPSLTSDPMGVNYSDPNCQKAAAADTPDPLITAAAVEEEEEEEPDDEVDVRIPPPQAPGCEKIKEGELDIDPTKTYLLQFDGGARGNPKGVAGAGMVLYNDAGEEVWCGWKFLSTAMSNNQAEYYAVLLGLQCARSLGVQRIRCEGDSDLIVKQLTGVYKVKNEGLRELWGVTVDVMRQFERCEMRHIFRESNKRADWLANNAMDNKTSYGFDEVPID